MKRPRINGQITASQVRILDEDGRELAVLRITDALKLVASRREDLVEIKPDEVPPICQSIDYGKFRYRQIQEEKKRWSRFRGPTKRVSPCRLAVLIAAGRRWPGMAALSVGRVCTRSSFHCCWCFLSPGAGVIHRRHDHVWASAGLLKATLT
jgi:hypothetical protein